MAGAVLRRRVTDWFHASIRFAAQLVSVLQVLLFLPLTLDIAGQDCMLALSLLLTLSFACSATLHLCVRTNTRWRPLSTLVAWLQPLVIPALLLLTLNLYSTSSTGEATLAVSDEDRHPAWLDHVRAAPSYWERLLRTSSPVFVILEGLCTLLCIQALSRFSLGRIQASRAPDLFRMGSLILAAGVYVASAYFLWEVRSRVLSLGKKIKLKRARPPRAELRRRPGPDLVDPDRRRRHHHPLPLGHLVLDPKGQRHRIKPHARVAFPLPLS